MNIDICVLVLPPLPPCVYLSQSEVEVMPTQRCCPLSTHCLSHVASHDLMIRLKHLIIHAAVCVSVCCLNSFIHSSMCTCITAAALFTAAPHHGSVYVCARLSTRFRAPFAQCSESCLLHLAPALWPEPPSLLLPYSYLPAVSLFCCHLRCSSHFIIWLTNPSWHPFHECLSKLK